MKFFLVLLTMLTFVGVYIMSAVVINNRVCQRSSPLEKVRMHCSMDPWFH